MHQFVLLPFEINELEISLDPPYVMEDVNIISIPITPTNQRREADDEANDPHKADQHFGPKNAIIT